MEYYLTRLTLHVFGVFTEVTQLVKASSKDAAKEAVRISANEAGYENEICDIHVYDTLIGE